MLEVLKVLFEHHRALDQKLLVFGMCFVWCVRFDQVRERLRVVLARCHILEEQLTAAHKEVRPDKAQLQRTVSVIIMSRWVNVALWVVVAGKEQSNQNKMMISSVQNLHAPKSHHKSNRYDELIN